LTPIGKLPCVQATIKDTNRLINSFDYTRWLTPGQISNESKAAFSPFGAGSRICLGLHLARMELRLATVCFFKECNKARLAPSVTPESMEVENYFLITPKSHRCEVVL